MVLAKQLRLEVDILKGTPGVCAPAPLGIRTPTTIFSTAAPQGSKGGGRCRCALATAQMELYLRGRGTVDDPSAGQRRLRNALLLFACRPDEPWRRLDEVARWALSHRSQAFRALLQYCLNWEGAPDSSSFGQDSVKFKWAWSLVSRVPGICTTSRQEIQSDGRHRILLFVFVIGL